MQRLHYTVKGMSCAACVAHMERAVRGVLEKEDTFTVSLLTNSLTVIPKKDMDEAETRELVARLCVAVRAAGYELVTEAEREPHADAEYQKRRTRLILSAFFTAAVMYLAMGGMIGLPIPPFLSGAENAVWMASVQLLLTLPVVILNFKFFRSGVTALLHRAPNMDSLIAVGAGASLVYGVIALFMIATARDTETVHSWMHDLYFEAAAMILTLVSLGKLLETRAKDKAADSVRALATLSPKFATLVEDGSARSVSVDRVRVGDLLLIRSGELIPVDGEVVEGNGTADESALTGESMPVEKSEGSTVRAACVLTAGVLKVRATGVGEDTSLARIVRLLEDAASSKAPIARIADRVSAVFVPCVMAISALTLILWLALTGDAERALRSAIAVPVISCPCALGLATPTAITVGIGRGARNGILFKNAEALEKLCRVRTVVLDKTGTVTEGKPSMTELYAYGGLPAAHVLACAATVEQLSSHPLAQAVARAAEEASLPLSRVTDFSALTAVGAEGRLDGRLCFVGKPDAAARAMIDACTKQAAGSLSPSSEPDPRFRATVREFAGRESVFSDFAALEASGKTAVLVTLDGETIGVIGISDRIRTDSRATAEAFRLAGIETLMLTGDQPAAAAFVAHEANLDAFRASLLPEDKERIVRELSETAPCAMVGDGINDAPALVRADVGIAIGAGTEIAVDSADVVLTGASLLGAVDAVSISRATIRIIKQNLFWALFYNAVCIPVAAGLFYPVLHWQLNPMLGSAAMSLSSVCVVLNALRLRRVPLSPAPQNHLKGESDMLFSKEKTYRVSIEGMMCPRCVAHVTKALETLKGVRSVTVSLEAGSAEVRAAASPDAVKAAIEAAGYGVVSIKED